MSYTLKKYKFYIGIDPGVETGMAIWSVDAQRFLSVESVSFWACAKILGNYSENKMITSALVRIEDPNLNPPTFARKGTHGSVINKISQNVGSNKRDAQLLIELCGILGLDCEPVKPASAKWDDAYFKTITKYTGRTSQHARDAGKLVFGYK